MAINGKPALQSITMLGSLLVLTPELAECCQELVGTGVFGPQAAAALRVVGVILAVLGRIRAKGPIASLF